MGEFFNGTVQYVANYQGSLTAKFNYSLYYSINDGFKGIMTILYEYWAKKNIYIKFLQYGEFSQEL